MSRGQEIHDWGVKEGLSLDTITVLLDQGFESLTELRQLTHNDVTEFFQKKGLLPLAKCLTLRSAVFRLSGGVPSPYFPLVRGYSPPEDQFQPGVPSPYGQQHDHYHLRITNPLLQTYQPRESLFERQEASNGPIFEQQGPLDSRFSSSPGQAYQPRGTDYHLQESPYQPAFEQERYKSHGAGRSLPDLHHDETDLSTASGATSIGGRHSGKSSKEFRLLLLGKTGSGKSTTGNTIFGEDLFQASANFTSVTADCELKRSYMGGRKMEIMDSPGLFDTTLTHDQVGTIIIQNVAGMHPGPNAILYVVKVGRYTAEEYSAYTRLKALFDPIITRYMIVLFTGGDELEKNGQSIDSIVQGQSGNIKTVLNECNNRYVLFNNFATDPRPQVERLLDMVRQLTRENGDPYACPKYMEIGESVEAEVARRMEEVDKKELERQKYVQQLQKQTEDTQQALSKTKEDMQRKEQEQQRQMEQLTKQQEQEMKLLKQQMEEQKLSDEKRLQEERALREHQENKKQNMLDEMEEQRRMDQQRFKEIEEKRQKLENEYTKLEREMGKQELERQKYVQQLQKQMEDTQQALSKTKEDMHRKEQEQQRQTEQFAKQQEQQMKLLKQQMEEQKLSDEMRLQEQSALRERQQEELQKMVARMKQQRREDVQRFQEMLEKRQRLEAERVQREREMQEERERRREREMNKVKDEAVERKEPGFFSTLLNTVLRFFKF